MKAAVRIGFAVGALAVLGAMSGCSAMSGAQRDTMVQLPDGIAVDAASVAGWKALQRAAQDGDLPLAQALVAAGADFDQPNDLGSSPLTNAVLRSHEDVVAFLLERGADANRRSANGIPLLHEAAAKGDTGIARLLIQHGARMDAADILGRTALHYAAGEGRLEVAQVLLAHGAGAAAMDFHMQTPLDVAETSDSADAEAVAALLRVTEQADKE